MIALVEEGKVQLESDRRGDGRTETQADESCGGHFV